MLEEIAQGRVRASQLAPETSQRSTISIPVQDALRSHSKRTNSELPAGRRKNHCHSTHGLVAGQDTTPLISWTCEDSGAEAERRTPLRSIPGTFRGACVSCHSGRGSLMRPHFSTGRFSGSTRTRIVRGCLGIRSISCARWRLRIIWCTVGGVTRKYSCMSASAGGPAVDLRVGMNESQVLSLPFGEHGRCGVAARSILIHQGVQEHGGPDKHTTSSETSRIGTRRTEGPACGRETAGPPSEVVADPSCRGSTSV